MSYQDRQREIVCKAAEIAQQQPILESGLWFHHDSRDNFYYASYLFAAAVDYPEQADFEAEAAKTKATAILLEVLQLQDQNPDSGTYGHWPLNLEPSPRQAKPHILPVELMGSLMAFFVASYKSHFCEPLAIAFDSALAHIYRSGFYRMPLQHINHHEAKYTAAKLIFGQRFEDAVLLEDGRRSLEKTLRHIQKHGMSEYGSLPWFWHWVQAFTCAWQLIEDTSIKKQLSEMLDYLWNERAGFYLKGAWVGTHSRGLKHDIPLDGNVLHDYVQFGDFKLPEQMPRTEYAGFLYYEAPEAARSTALNRTEPVEVTKLITKHAEAGSVQLHSYAYVTPHFAAGGMWERYTEFDNEQHRWDITLPVDQQAGVNQAYFYHPAERFEENDPRHQSEYAEVLFYKNTIMALYPIPEGEEKKMIGILPVADWHQEWNSLLGQTDHVYWAVYLMQPYHMSKLADRCIITSESSRNGVVIEAIAKTDAEQLGLHSFEAFISEAKRRNPVWKSRGSLEVQYTNMKQTVLQLAIDHEGSSFKSINGQPVDFNRYTV